MDYTHVLSEYADNLTFEKIPDTDIEAGKKLILDYFAASAAGYHMNPLFNRALEEVLFDMGGKEESRVLFHDRRLPAPHAALLSGAYCHGADMDDGHKRAMGHVGSHVIASVFALSDVLNPGGREILTAITVGYDVYVRISEAAQPSLLQRGFHSTGMAGAIASAAACAKLMGLGNAQIYHAMALAATQASGLLLVAESGQMCKPINPGRAAQTGILSARLAEKGVQGPRKPLDSDKGFFHAVTDQVDFTAITRGLGSRFSIGECYCKPYPSCRHTHCGIEAAIKLRPRLGDRSEIEKINLHIYPTAIEVAGQIQIPETNDDAKFSIHYALACALCLGSFGLTELETRDILPEVVGTIQKIDLIPDESMESRCRGIRGARLEIVLTNGETSSETVHVPKGDPECPLSWGDLEQKLLTCSMGKLSREGVRSVSSEIQAMEKLTSFADLSMFNRT